MPSICRTPGEAESPLARAFGAVPELIVQGDYCRAKGGCGIFLAPGQPGVTDFFDRVTGFHGCRHLTAFLKDRNPTIDELVVGGWCEGRKILANDRSLIPDIITHQPNRYEFYEIKPASAAGLASGRLKIANFELLCAGQMIPYVAGVQYQPHLKILVFDGTWLTVPCKAFLHIDFEQPGLLIYQVCVEANSAWMTEAMANLLIKMVAAALILLATRAPGVAIGAAAAAVLLVTLTNSPLLASVGGDGEQDASAVQYVQWLVNDHRDRNGLATVREDGELDDDTRTAITEFQQQELGWSSGVVEPGEATVRKLEELHLANTFAQVGGVEQDEAIDARMAVLAEDEAFDLAAMLGAETQSYLDGLYAGWQE